jgi:hypothetical protein
MVIGWKMLGILPVFYQCRRMLIFKCLKKQDKNGGGGGSRTVVQLFFINDISVIFCGARNLTDSVSCKHLAIASPFSVYPPVFFSLLGLMGKAKIVLA